MPSSRAWVVPSLALLYASQGIPYGFAVEYLPVVLREQSYSLTQIAAIGWLQLPWQLKVLWARAADHPAMRTRARTLLLFFQIALAANVAAFAAFSLREAPAAWFVLIALSALIASSQDIFVDALAVRTLHVDERGYGNVAQVAGYRLGMLAGGAGLLLLSGKLGGRATMLACAGAILVTSLAAFTLAQEGGEREAPPLTKPGTARALFKRMISEPCLPVIAVAASFKLGLHMASSLLKPMAVDAGWSKVEIGAAVVAVGTVSGLIGAGLGGVVHRTMRETRALAFAAIAQAVTCVPVALACMAGAPKGLTTAAIACEHFASGLGTTVLFAALMTATRPSQAGLHYTVLTSINSLGIGVAGLLAGALADRLGKTFVLWLSAGLCLLPLMPLRNWADSARASAAEE